MLTPANHPTTTTDVTTTTTTATATVILCDCRTCMEQSSYQHHSINLFAIFQETT